MIFVITGTHEQPFDRLVGAMDAYAAELAGRERIVIQSGYTRTPLRHAEGEAMFPLERMHELASEARAIVTHGGPGSVFLAFQHDVIPLVVPRRRTFGEHVDDHQVAFARHLGAAGRAPCVLDVERLPALLDDQEAALRGYAAPAGATEGARQRLAQELETMLEDPRR